MVVVTGRLNGAINGIIRATPDHVFIDFSTNPDTVVMLPTEAPITNGLFSINVPQSQNLSGQPGITTEGITYKWELLQTIITILFYLLDGTQYTGPFHQWTSGAGFDNNWWTGLTHDATSRRLDRVSQSQLIPILDAIHAVAPDSSTAVDFAMLIAVSALQPYLDISLYRLAELLTTVATYRDRISTKFALRGLYSASTFYVFGDIVRFNGNGYAWRNTSSLQGQQPPMSGDNANWMMVTEKGAAGGTGAQIVGYNPTTWANSAEAAAREDVRAAIASVGSVNLTQYLLKTEAASTYLQLVDGAPRVDPTFSGKVKRGVLSYPITNAADRLTEVPTAQYVDDGLAAIARLGAPLVHARRVTQFNLTASTEYDVFWDNRIINTGNILDTNGVFTIPENGRYLIYCKLSFRVVGTFAGNRSRVILISRLWQAGANIGEFFNDNQSTVDGTFSLRRDGWQYATFSAGNTFSIGVNVDRQEFSGSAAGISTTANAHSIAPGGNGGANNFMLMWRVN